MMRKKKLYSVLASVLAACILLVGLSKPALSEISVKEALSALTRYVCYWDYWGASVKSNKIATVMLDQKADSSYMWIENMIDSGWMPHRVDYVVIKNKGKFLVVSSRQVLDMDIDKEKPFHEELRKEFFNNHKVKSIQWKTPDNCSPHYDPDSPEKQKMLSIILKTVHDGLASLHKYPVKTKIVISNFNVDYPEVLAFIPHTNEIFNLPLHYENEPFDKELEVGSYNFGQIYDKESIYFLKKKILENGIPFELDLSRPFTL
ncbi:MAG TPA: hypothetical protein VHL08_06230 [Dongiaceae bacterium]|jgi:hypothetical protein|nr:hypothetical protein [Dongiaceae bacterium]